MVWDEGFKISTLKILDKMTVLQSLWLISSFFKLKQLI